MQRNWEELAKEIILRAVEDYRKARRKLSIYPNLKRALATVQETEQFFESWWFAQLTDLDGERFQTTQAGFAGNKSSRYFTKITVNSSKLQ